MQDATKTSKAVTRVAANTVQREIARLYGTSTRGAVKLLSGGIRLFGDGRLHAVSREENGKRWIKRTPEYTTPGYAPQADTEERILCVCRKTGRKYRFIGRTRPAKKQPVIVEGPQKQTHRMGSGITPVAMEFEGNTDSGATGTVDTVRQEAIALTPQIECTKLAQMDMQELQAELEAIGAMRKAGLDPSLRLRHVCTLTRRSRAALYRDIQQAKFPAPLKRGKGSFWPLSQIEAYLAGEWQAT